MSIATCSLSGVSPEWLGEYLTGYYFLRHKATDNIPFSNIQVEQDPRVEPFHANIKVRSSTDIGEWINLALTLSLNCSRDVGFSWNNLRYRIDHLSAQQNPDQEVHKIQSALFSEIMFCQSFLSVRNGMLEQVPIAIFRPQQNQTIEDIVCTAKYISSVSSIRMYVACSYTDNSRSIYYMPIKGNQREIRPKNITVMTKPEFDENVSSASVQTLYLLSSLGNA